MSATRAHVENRPSPNQRYVITEGEYGGFKILDLHTTPCAVVTETKASPAEYYNRIPGEEWKPSQAFLFASYVCRLLNADHEMRVAVDASVAASKSVPPEPAKKARGRRKP